MFVCSPIKDSDQPAYPHNLISGCSLDSQGLFLLRNARALALLACAISTKIAWIHAILLVIAYASREGLDKPAHPHTCPRVIVSNRYKV